MEPEGIWTEQGYVSVESLTPEELKAARARLVKLERDAKAESDAAAKADAKATAKKGVD